VTCKLLFQLCVRILEQAAISHCVGLSGHLSGEKLHKPSVRLTSAVGHVVSLAMFPSLAGVVLASSQTVAPPLSRRMLEQSSFPYVRAPPHESGQ
jgi:hypothetical protein